MRTFIQIGFVLLSTSILFAQAGVPKKLLSTPKFRIASERVLSSIASKATTPGKPLAAQVAVSGATDVGITGKWYIQTNRGGLHNVQVDPSNPNNIHVCAMQAFGVTPDDTLDDSYYLNRRVYYVFSSDGGTNWTAPRAISSLRTGYPEMILMQRDGKYIPLIAAHCNVSSSTSDVITCLYIESGNPGDGNFTEVETSRNTYNDDERDIIWPSLALSNDGTKVFVVASPFDNPIDYLQFGTFTFNPAKTDAIWSGWVEGPAANDDRALTTGGDYLVRVAPSGKIGVVWQNQDYGTPDLGLYYSESTDGGSTWSAPDNLYFPHGTDYEVNGESYSLAPAGGLDFIFDGEDPVVSFAAYLSNMLNSGGSYVPATGSLLFWRKGYTDAKLLLWKTDGGITTDHGDPIHDGSFLSGWSGADGVDPGGANLQFCTMGFGSDPKQITIFFEAWVQDDFGEIGEFPGDPERFAAPFHSIWKMTTTDGGDTWSAPEAIFANDLTGTERIDYRYPSVSKFNPTSGGNVTYNLSFAADDAPGNNQGNGENNFSDVTIFYAKHTVQSGPPPQFETPSAVDFGDQRVLTSKDTTFYLFNRGTTPITIASYAITGPTGVFELIDTSQHTIAGGDSIAMTVRFSALAAQLYTGSLVVKTAEAPQITRTISLQGRGIAPNLVAPSTIVFGDQKILTARDTTIFLYNTGSASLTIASYELSVTAGAFSLVDSAAHFIAAKDSITITIRLEPQEEATYQGSLAIATLEAPEQTKTISLVARGVNTKISVSQPIIDFGGIDTGKSATQDLIITNTGTTAVTINALQLTGTGLDQFSLPNLTLPFTIAEGGSMTISVTFAPQLPGTHGAILEITPSEGSVLNVLLQGVGKTSTAGVQRNRNTISFRLSPNPARDVLTASFTIAAYEEISLAVYTSDGKVIQAPGTITYDPGSHELRLTCDGLPSGEYIVRVIGRNTLLAEDRFILLR